MVNVGKYTSPMDPMGICTPNKHEFAMTYTSAKASYLRSSMDPQVTSSNKHPPAEISFYVEKKHEFQPTPPLTHPHPPQPEIANTDDQGWWEAIGFP